MPKHRIALAGLACECCTFSPIPTYGGDFNIAQDDEVAVCEAGAHFAAGLANSQLVGGWLGRALPGGPVDDSSYKRMRKNLLAGIAACGPIDGLLLDLHGAMAVEGMDDAEADLLAAIRKAVGPALPIAAALDLHGNISQALVSRLDALSAYRTAPHIDVAETRGRAAVLLEKLLAGWRPHKAWVRIPALLTGEQTSTECEPGRTVWDLVEQANRRPGVHDASLFVGYAWADEPRTGACAICHADDPASAKAVAEELASAYWSRRKEFVCQVPVLDPEAALTWAAEQPRGPVVISDASDNPTAGGTGDVSAMLAHAQNRHLPSCLIAGIADEYVTKIAFRVDVCAKLEIKIGARLAPSLSKPCEAKMEVYATYEDDGDGDVALLRKGSLMLAVTERRRTFHRLKDFERLGIMPAGFDIIVVKLGYLEPQLKELAQAHCLASGPGCVPPVIRSLTYRRAQREFP